jgi:hypothetical protein
MDDWNRWLSSEDRATIDNRIESLTGEPTKYSTYASMVPNSDAQASACGVSE